jgi:hypothetical protein
MAKQRLWIGIIFAGVAILFAASRIFAPTTKTTDSNTSPATTTSESPTSNEPQTTASDEASEGWQRIERETYTIDVPSAWTINTSDPLNLWLESGGKDEAYVDPDIVNVRVSEVQKKGRTLDEILNEEIWDEADVELVIAFMQEAANPPYNEISRKDISIERGEVVIGAQTAVRALRQCLVPCYIEGGPFTDIQYFVDAGERVYILTARSGVDVRAAALLLIGEQVMKTFRFKTP